jgi:hypothetical protein
MKPMIEDTPCMLLSFFQLARGCGKSSSKKKLERQLTSGQRGPIIERVLEHLVSAPGVVQVPGACPFEAEHH